MQENAQEHQEEPVRHSFFVDDREIHTHKHKHTGGEIMELAGVPIEIGLLLIFEDGMQHKVEVEEVIEIIPTHRFKKKPRFKRGSHE